MALQQEWYMKKLRRNLYIALEELDLVFNESEMIQLRKMWDQDKDIFKIAKEVGRYQLEIIVLIMDQADKNKIKSRPMGVEA